MDQPVSSDKLLRTQENPSKIDANLFVPVSRVRPRLNRWKKSRGLADKSLSLA